MKMRDKKKLPVYQVTSEYAACLEQTFAPGAAVVPGAASGGATAAPGANLGGAMSITPLSNRLGCISEDTAHLSVWADWGVNGDILFRRFARAQRASQGKAETEEVEEDEEPYAGMYVDLSKAEFFDDPAIQTGGEDYGADHYMESDDSSYVELGGTVWKMAASGKGTGESGRSYYKYKLMNGGVNLFFRKDKHETVANLWIEMGSIPLCQRGGLQTLWSELKTMLEQEGIIIIKDIVSRVDIYSDFDMFEVEECCRRFYENCKVTRARKIGKYAQEDLNTAMYMNGYKHTGFSIGTDIKLRVYDKRYELRTDPLKWGVFADKYDGIPETLTRVEFQLRRNALKEFNTENGGRIEGVESYLKMRDQLWRYLTEDWFRLTEDKVDKDNNHQSRAKSWIFWDVVANAVTAVVECVQRIRRKTKINPEHLFKMGMGCIIKAALLEEGSRGIDGPGDVRQYFWDKMKSYGIDYYWHVENKHAGEIFLRMGLC